MSADLVRALSVCREAEKEQALYYRALSALAEREGKEDLAQRFHGLHADEQHHLSRLTARLVELGHHPADLSQLPAPPAGLEGWEPPTRRREHDEIRRYEILLAQELDEESRALVREILEVERQHAEQLGGKWTMA